MKLKEQVSDTELKLMLNNKQVLENKDSLKSDFRSLFQIDEDAQYMSVWYLETPAQGLRKDGWSVRYRQKEESHAELTIKKRYEEKDYRAMLDTKYADILSCDFKPEIDMTYTKKTFSLSYERVFSDDVKIDEAEAKRLAIINSPAAFTNYKNKNFGFNQLCASKLLGPVKASTYKGKFEDYEAKLEIWKLKDYLCEISFDIPSKKSTDLKRDMLKLLAKNDLLLTIDILKTDAMLDYYAKKNEQQN